MNKLLLIFVFVLVVSCKENEVKKAPAQIQTKKVISNLDTVKKIKFSTPIKYKKYRVDTFSVKRVHINFATNKTARRFRSAIKWSIDNFGMNFGGHYNLARWGCGTSCQTGVITDLITGHVYDLPPATGDYEFRRNSILLVVNPPDSTGYYDNCSYCIPELYRWNEDRKRFERLK
jgi:hypothetical protein